MDLTRNRFEHGIAEGKLPIGLSSQMVSALAVEVIVGDPLLTPVLLHQRREGRHE